MGLGLRVTARRLLYPRVAWAWVCGSLPETQRAPRAPLNFMGKSCPDRPAQTFMDILKRDVWEANTAMYVICNSAEAALVVVIVNNIIIIIIIIIINIIIINNI